jgi:uncharacterized membrane protein YgdD (TMEM256/DUF423 family)
MCERCSNLPAMNHRTTLLAAGLLGLTAVALGAFGAHALREPLLERGMTSAWETAARYQLVHAVALFAAAAWQNSDQVTGTKPFKWAVLCWISGTVLFSGSLYLLALGGPRWLGPVTPLGGIALLAGWLCVVAGAWTKDK